jgi:hypothetical protein
MSPKRRATTASPVVLGPPPRLLPLMLRWRVVFSGEGTRAWWLFTLLGVVVCTVVAPHILQGPAYEHDYMPIIFAWPSLAIAAAGWCMHRNGQRLGILRHGKPVEGLVIERGTNPSSVTFEYEVDGVKRRIKVLGKRSEDTHTEPLLYDPAAPHRAAPLDDLPGDPIVAEGVFVPPRPPIDLLIPPVLALLALIVLVIRTR